jgi:hypothetical protein
MKSKIAVFAFLALSSSSFATLQFDNNVEANLQNQMKGDLAFMAGVQGNSGTALHQQIFGAVSGPVYASWFQQRIFSIGKNNCGDSAAVACVIPGVNPNKMWVTPNYTNFNHPQIARISVIYHEARHSESQNNNWQHATCPTPFVDANGKTMVSIWTGVQLQGQPACDITPYGSYGSQTILLKNMAMNCSNCNSKVKADAELYGEDQLGRITDPTAKAQMVADFAQ